MNKLNVIDLQLLYYFLIVFIHFYEILKQEFIFEKVESNSIRVTVLQVSYLSHVQLNNCEMLTI